MDHCPGCKAAEAEAVRQTRLTKEARERADANHNQWRQAMAEAESLRAQVEVLRRDYERESTAYAREAATSNSYLAQLSEARAELEAISGYVQCMVCGSFVKAESSYPSTMDPESSPICWACGPGQRQLAEAQQRAKRLTGLLTEDAAGRPVPELLRLVADVCRRVGGGPMEDCLRILADGIEAALPEEQQLHPPKEGE